MDYVKMKYNQEIGHWYNIFYTPTKGLKVVVIKHYDTYLGYVKENPNATAHNQDFDKLLELLEKKYDKVKDFSKSEVDQNKVISHDPIILTENYKTFEFNIWNSVGKYYWTNLKDIKFIKITKFSFSKDTVCGLFYYSKDSQWIEDCIYIDQLIKPMTVDEIECELYKIAYRFGYYGKGVKIIDLNGKVVSLVEGRYYYDFDKDSLFFKGSEIYRKGQWAQIINNNTNVVAVYAPFNWQKEKVAKVMELDFCHQVEDYDKYSIVYANGNMLNWTPNIKNAVIRGFNIYMFEQFMNENNKSFYPDYIKGLTDDINYEVYKFTDGTAIVLIDNGKELKLIYDWKPITYRDYINNN